MKQFKRFLILYVVIPIGVLIFKLIGATCRLKEMNAAKMTPRQGKEKQYIYAFEHSQLLEMIYFYRNSKMASLASLSKDGEIAAVIAEHFGITILRGSSSRGGAAALMGLKTLVEQGFDIALTVDGPRGPLGTVNAGVVYLAKLTGIEIVPACFCCDKAVRLHTWDKFLILKPFSTGFFNFGKAIKIPADLADNQIDTVKNQIRADLDRINDECGEAVKNKHV